MDEINYVTRFWSQGKREEDVKDQVEITTLDLPGNLRLRYVQIPPESHWKEKPAIDECYVFQKGYGSVSKGREELGVTVGHVIHVEHDKEHTIINKSLAQTLEFLIFDSKEKE